MHVARGSRRNRHGRLWHEVVQRTRAARRVAIDPDNAALVDDIVVPAAATATRQRSDLDIGMRAARSDIAGDGI
jgi:hypothetical protein